MVRERMGSGGPRGLQIPRSGASRVRGGFDSHAFPPLSLAVAFATLVTLLLAAPAARATRELAPPDSLTRGPLPDTSAVLTGRPVLRWSEQPRFVMLRSLAIPGWGQWHNHARFKALAVAGAEGWIVAGIFDDQRQMNRLLGDVNAAKAAKDQAALDVAVNGYNSHLDGFIGGQWFLAGVLAYAMVDAYVDAHFRTFDIDFRHDPALPRDAAPEGTPPAHPAGRPSARLSLRWHF